jgi:hypothetical protein
MAVPLFTNNATGTLAGSYTAGATAITLTAGQGALFPSPSGGDWFMLTVVNNLNAIEVMKVTARVSDTLTVVRGQEGTAARALSAGEKASLRITAGVLAALRDKVQQTADIADGSITNSKLANLSVDGNKLALNCVFGIHLTAGAVDASKMAVNAAIGNLGFTPPQQGTGAGQTTDTLKLGWSASAKMRLQVNATDVGFFLNEKQDGSADSAGYRGLPNNLQNANYGLALTDAGGRVLHSAGSHTYTVPDDTTAFQAGSIVQVINDGGTLSIAPAGGVTLVWSPTGATGSRTLAASGVATLEKISSNRWYVYGAGLS